MSSDLALQLLRDLLWNTLLISAPLLGITLVVGLIVTVFQVVTQVQEMSLTFVPKIVAAIVTLVVLGPWMLKSLLAFSTSLITNIPSYF